MFNFIFEGKIAEILAPVSGISSQLCLAVQHHRNEDVRNLVDSASSDLSKCSDSGYHAIHVACRYNNRFAFDLLTSRGVSVDMIDSAGNTPLHFASKYGNIDMCKVLTEKGCPVGKKNGRGQTAYDVAESHVVRQYLLPLQLQSEREAYGGQDSSQSGYGGYASGYSHAGTFGAQLAPATYGSTIPIPGAVPPATAIDSSLQQPAPPAYGGVPSLGLAQPTAIPSVAAPPGGVNPGGEISPVTYTPGGTALKPTTSSSSRLIQPDGFHTSMSDPELQKRYRHNKATINIAPPPTGPMGGSVGGPPVYSLYGQPPSAGGVTPPVPGTASSVYNRYVAYDPHTGTGMQPPPGYAPSPPGSTYTQPPSVSPPGSAASIGPPGSPAAFAPPGPPAAVQAASPRVGLGLGLASGPLVGPPGGGGVGVGAVRVPSDSGPLVNVNVFNPATDHIISADSTSSSVL